MMKQPNEVDKYIAGFPEHTQGYLSTIRKAFKKVAPTSTEKISYGIPALDLNGQRLIYFAGFKKHVSIFPAPRGHESFKKELSNYKGGKGTIQFPLDKPLPMGLINRLIKFRIKANKEIPAKKAKKS